MPHAPEGGLLPAAARAPSQPVPARRGISYNFPYCKDVPLAHSLAAWREVDALTGELHRAGLTMDRELFGTLTAVLVPRSISLAIGVVEAMLAAAEGVRCISISYPQLTRRYLPADVEVYPSSSGEFATAASRMPSMLARASECRVPPGIEDGR